ncbi:hypothetical protein CC85DRAFT_326057 [Cutaneotrichosporon oleaginosum]|uniref:Uncharacterized protein n=1 Tax=Cutaneotrichosporon oleaginosum TaxID=879819 RepID=A0A0J0XVT7_9TREE|nr:uncharacterized protein CC85DRAFT_326057 [Cutaneotrichosporon oleaginosum]KLT45148.1 hypothetical protein CC85DRAFT_326057 [Cutaneotrichosporon oleaginosum]TXT09828.1 hypothetical protein COLE_03762 [Cutaneotrichosporon oleaginosum]
MPDDDNKKTRHVSSLNAKLLAHGYAKRPLKLDRLSESEQVHVANVITELLGSSVTNLSAIEELNGRLRTIEYERDRLYKSSERFETRCARLEAELSASKARETSSAHALATEQEVTKSLRNDVERGRKAIESLRVAAGQEAKRAQLKADKLRDQLARQPIPPIFELLNPVARGASAPAAPGALPLLEAGLRDLSDLRASLQEEAEAFRHVVVSTANGLSEALAASEGKESRVLLPNQFFDGGYTAHPAIADAKLRALVGEVRSRLTMDMARGAGEEDPEDIEAHARAERERAKAEADLRDRVKDLEVEIAIVRGREEEARRVADEAAKLNVHASVPSTTDFEDARLREELVRQKRVLDAERAQLRDEAMRLHEQQLAFEAERALAEARAAELRAAERAAEERLAAETTARLAALELSSEAAKPTVSTSSSSSFLSISAAPPHPAPTRPTGHPAAPTTPRKHVPARPSPLSPHSAGALKRQVSPKKPKLYTKKRPSLARAVMDRQHRRSVEAASPRLPVSTAAKRDASLRSSFSSGASSGSGGVLGEGGKKGNAAGSAGEAPKRKSSSLTAGTAASLARSARKPEVALGKRKAAGAWR